MQSKAALVLELMGKNVARHFSEMNCRFSEKTCCMLAIRILDCLKQLHSASFIHGDLKPENILTGRKSLAKDGHIVLADFGMTKSFRCANGSHLLETDLRDHKTRGTVRYMSIRQKIQVVEMTSKL